MLRRNTSHSDCHVLVHVHLLVVCAGYDGRNLWTYISPSQNSYALEVVPKVMKKTGQKLIWGQAGTYTLECLDEVGKK